MCGGVHCERSEDVPEREHVLFRGKNFFSGILKLQFFPKFSKRRHVFSLQETPGSSYHLLPWKLLLLQVMQNRI
jgi:hypothetical protein